MQKRGARKALTFLPTPLFLLSEFDGSIARKLIDYRSRVIKVPVFKLIIFEHFLNKLIFHIFIPFIYRSRPSLWQIHLPLSRNSHLKCHQALNRTGVIFSVAGFSLDAGTPRFDQGFNEIHFRGSSLSGLVGSRGKYSSHPRAKVCRAYVRIILLAFFVLTFNWSRSLLIDDEFGQSMILLERCSFLLNFIILLTKGWVIPILPLVVLIIDFLRRPFLRDYFRLFLPLLYELILIRFRNIWLNLYRPAHRCADVLFIIENIMIYHATLSRQDIAPERCMLKTLLFQKFWFGNINFFSHFQNFK